MLLEVRTRICWAASDAGRQSPPPYSVCQGSRPSGAQVMQTCQHFISRCRALPATYLILKQVAEKRFTSLDLRFKSRNFQLEVRDSRFAPRAAEGACCVPAQGFAGFRS